MPKSKSRSMFRSLPVGNACCYSKSMKSRSLHHDNIQLLQAEAEKIRNWNLQTEMNTRNMEKVVQNLRLTIESQRKSLLEVQMEYEAVGNKMQEELNKRTLCFKKIDATRDMCSLLKEQACGLESTLTFCCNVKDNLESKSSEQNDIVQKLILDFNKLVSDLEQCRAEYKTETLMCKQELEETKEDFEKHFKDAKVKILDYENVISESSLTNDVLIFALSREQQAVVKKNKNSQVLVSSVTSTKKNVNTTMLNTIFLEASKKDLLVLLKEKTISFGDLQKKLEVNHYLNLELKKRLNEVERKISQHLQTIEDLKCDLEQQTTNADTLEMNLQEKVKKLKLLAQDNVALKMKVKDTKVQVAQLTALRDILLQHCCVHITEKKIFADLFLYHKRLSIQFHDEAQQLKANKESLHKQVLEMRTEKNDLSLKLQETIAENQSLKCELQSVKDTVGESNVKLDDCKSKEAEFQAKFEDMGNDNENLRSSIQRLQTDLKQKEAIIQALEENLGSHENKLKESRQKADESLLQLEKKAKQLDNLEDTIQQLKAASHDQTKALDISARLYNELLIIKNDQAQELTGLYRDLETKEKSLKQQEESFQKSIDELKQVHAEEVLELKSKLSRAEDKLAILKEEHGPKEASLLVSPQTRKKKRRYTSLTAKDVSSDFQDWFTASKQPTPIRKHSITTKSRPKHSTPVQRASEPIHYLKARKNSRSAKRSAGRVSTTLNLLMTKQQVCGKDRNWYDTDKTFGFFD